jgi:hypothetical protein
LLGAFQGKGKIVSGLLVQRFLKMLRLTGKMGVSRRRKFPWWQDFADQRQSSFSAVAAAGKGR